MDISVLHLNDLTTEEVRTFNLYRSLISARKIKSISQKSVSIKMGVDARLVNSFEKRYASIISGDFEAAYKAAVEELLAEQAQTKGVHHE